MSQLIPLESAEIGKRFLGNQQPTEKRIERHDGALEIVDTWRTIQGEAVYAGRPAVFIRTAGCNLQCMACDTDYTTGRHLRSVDWLTNKVSALFGEMKRIPHQPLVVITGGEPFRQNCGGLARQLYSLSYLVQFESNGTLYDPSMVTEWSTVCVVCSPKTGKLDSQLQPHINHYKYILQAGEVDPDDGLPTSSLMTGVRPARPHVGFKGNVYLQPLDEGNAEKNAANVKAVVESCQQYGHLLCLQTHKIVGLQ